MQNNSMQIELPPNLLEGTIKKFRNFVANTGCKSPNDTFLKINILKESLVLVKQTIPQQKALDLSFNLAP